MSRIISHSTDKIQSSPEIWIYNVPELFCTHQANQRILTRQFEYNQNQDKKVRDAIKAMHDLCDAVKDMDQNHQEQAFLGCLAVMAEEFHWK